MLAELIDKIRDVGRQADSLQLEVHDSLPETVFARFADRYEQIQVPPPRRAHTLLGFADIVAAVKAEEIAPAPEVFHDETGVRVLLNREDRRSTVSMPLAKTQRFARLEALTSGQDFDVRGAVKLLRFDLHGTGVDKVIGAIRRIDFTRRSEGAASADHGRESLGRSVEAAVQQADQVPEEFTVQTSVYANPGVRELSKVSVRCGVYLDVQNESIEIRVLADEIEAAVNAAQGAIGEALREQLGEVPVFYGAP